MADNIDIKVKLSTDGEQLSKALSDATSRLKDVSAGMSKVDGSIKNATKSSQTFLSSIVNIRTLLAGISLYSIYGIFTKAISEASEAEQTITDLNVALASAGNYSEQTSKEIQDLGKSLQETTIYSDEAVVSTAAYIENLTRLDKEGLKKVTAATVDLAAALNLDLNSASIAVSKALEGNSIALSKQGIQIKKGKDDAEQLANVLQALSKFEGQAEAKANTFSGALAKLSNQYSELFESAGGAITGNSSIIIAISSLSDILKDLNIGFKENKDSIRDITSAALNLAGVFTSMIGLALSFGKQLTNAFLLIKDFVQQAATGLAFVIFKVLDEVFSGIPLIGDAVTKAFNNVSRNFEKTTRNMKEDWKGFTDAFKPGVIDKAAAGFFAGASSVSKNAALGFQGNAMVNAPKGKIQEAEAKKERESATGTIGKEFTPEDTFRFLERFVTRIENMGIRNAARISFSTETFSKEITKIMLNAGNYLFQGAKGARQALVDIGGAAAEALIPGFGAAVKPFIDAFAQGPEFVKAMLSDFATGLVDALFNIVDTLSQLDVILVEVITKLLERIADRMPEFIQSLVRIAAISIGAQAPYIAVKFADAFIREIPRIIEGIAKGAYEGIKEALKSAGQSVGNLGGVLGPALGAGIGSAVAGPIGAAVGFITGKKLKFAQGGVVPEGYPQDSYPALLTSGERVLTPSQNYNLERLANGEGGRSQDTSRLESLMEQLIAVMTRPQQVNASINIGQRELASAILELNRNNMRLA